VKQIGAEFEALSPLIGGTQPSAEVAILNDYDSRWAIDIHRHHEEFDYVTHLMHYRRPLARRNVPVDIISADAGLDGYRLIIAPALHVLIPSRARRLRAFVESGGHLVLTARTGMKDTYNALLPMRQPGQLAEIAGVEVEDYYALEEPISLVGGSLMGTARVWAERVKLLDEDRTTVLTRYGSANRWLDGHAAVTSHDFGRGRSLFVGTWLDDHSQDVLMNDVVADAGVTPVMDTPPGVLARRRASKDSGEIIILVNHHRNDQRVTLPWPAHDHLGDRKVEGDLCLERYGVAVLTRLPT
jgi:beta-galactosidase